MGDDIPYGSPDQCSAQTTGELKGLENGSLTARVHFQQVVDNAGLFRKTALSREFDAGNMSLAVMFNNTAPRECPVVDLSATDYSARWESPSSWNFDVTAKVDEPVAKAIEKSGCVVAHNPRPGKFR